MDRPTFPGIAAAYVAVLRRWLLQLGVPAGEVDDVLQGVLFGVERGLPTFVPAADARSPEDALRAWLFGVCSRQAAGYRREIAKRAEVVTDAVEVELLLGSSPSPEDELARVERVGLVWKLLETLDPCRRAVVVGYGLEGLPMAAVAAGLGIPENTGWNRWRLGLANLRDAWKLLRRRGRA